MVILSNLCLIPSWIISIFQPYFQGALEDAGIDEFLIYAIHFTILYFFLFGILPKYGFEKMGLISSNLGYNHAPDDAIRTRIRSIPNNPIKLNYEYEGDQDQDINNVE